MKVLVINAGSSSLKYQLIDMADESVIASGGFEMIGQAGSFAKHNVGDDSKKVVEDYKDHNVALKALIAHLKESGVVKDEREISAIGHRVLHGGEDFDRSVLIDDEVIATLKKNIELGPLHMPANISCIELCREVFKGKPNVAVFDTSFHMTMPKKAYMYAIDYRDYENYKVRKYGFHGTSHKYVSQEAIKMLGAPEHSKVIVCHLGNGSSISAVKDGKSVDTSMGLTPLEGLMMGTRSGDIDPAAVQFLMKKKGMDIDEILTYLNKRCGFLGISGVASDSRKVTEAAANGNERAILTLEMTAYRIKKYIGSYIAALNGVDCIAFTGGIGEHSHETRGDILRDMEFLGIKLDEKVNESKDAFGKRCVISTPDSKVKVVVIPTNEELVIARETKELI